MAAGPGAIVIRDARETEYEMLAVRIVAIDPWKRLQRTAEGFLRMWRDDKTQRLVVAEVDSAVAGVIQFTATEGCNRIKDLGMGQHLVTFYGERGGNTGAAWPSAGYVRVVAVFPGHQGGGIGGRLLETAEREIAKVSDRVFLCVSEANPGARRLYERVGYKFVGAIHDCIMPGNTENLMTKPLSGDRP